MKYVRAPIRYNDQLDYNQKHTWLLRHKVNCIPTLFKLILVEVIIVVTIFLFDDNRCRFGLKQCTFRTGHRGRYAFANVKNWLFEKIKIFFGTPKFDYYCFKLNSIFVTFECLVLFEMNLKHRVLAGIYFRVNDALYYWMNCAWLRYFLLKKFQDW